jgi:hypothetical protein
VNRVYFVRGGRVKSVAGRLVNALGRLAAEHGCPEPRRHDPDRDQDPSGPRRADRDEPRE